MKLVAGLGNPGEKYKNTRHNAGFMAADKIREEFNFPTFVFNKKINGQISKREIKDEKIFILKPKTFMNDSGRSIQMTSAFYKIPAEDIIVIHDDSDLPLGKIRIKRGGSAGGHNGIKSIIKMLGNENFLRIKIGIRTSKTDKIPLDKFVLQRFGMIESLKIKKSIEEAAQAVLQVIQEGEEKTMSKYN